MPTSSLVPVTLGSLIVLVLIGAASWSLSHRSENENGRSDNAVAAGGWQGDVPRARYRPHRHKQKHPRSISSDCNSPYGSVNGVALGVAAYSNCNDSFISEQPYTIPLADVLQANATHLKHCDLARCPQDIFSGMKWQCVEYGRRFLLREFGAAFGSVNGASDIWVIDNITTYQLISSTEDGGCQCRVGETRWKTISNGASSDVWVKPKDLIIYPRGAVGPFGHVCAVVAVNTLLASKPTDPIAEVLVAEQNWNNAPWPVPSGEKAYARRLLLVPVSSTNRTLVLQDVDSDGLYPIDGVKRFVL